MTSPDPGRPRIRDCYPSFAAELARLLRDEGEEHLALCAYDLRIVERCECDDDFCQSFYSAEKPVGAYGDGHRNVRLQPKHGMLILDVVRDRIMYVEIIDHPPLPKLTARQQAELVRMHSTGD